MNRKNNNRLGVTRLVLAGLLLIAVVAVFGCKEKSEPTAPTKTEEVAEAAILQKTCPVMNLPIIKTMFTEYKDKKVYFCCAGCKPKFEKEPEKYIAKLPQFKN